MLIKQYLHRLPGDYDMERIRNRAAQRGALWDSVPGLAFKAFMIQQRGVYGSTRNTYSSLYLWRSLDGLTDFLFDARFQNVIATFGRPDIDTWIPIHVCKGSARDAGFVTIKILDIGPDTDLPALRDVEREQAFAVAAQAGVVANMVALDIRRWRLARFTVTETQMGSECGEVFKVAYFAKPGLQALESVARGVPS